MLTPARKHPGAPWNSLDPLVAYRVVHSSERGRLPASNYVKGGLSDMTTTTLASSPRVAVGDGQWAVETHGLTKRFGENIAVNDVELLVPRGCAFGYLGPNGAGKTTLIRVLLGLTHADAGTMFLLGHAVPRHRDLALARVGAIVDEPRFHGHLTGRQNLQILAAAREPAAKGRIEPSLERVGILHRAERQGVEVLHGHAPTSGRRRLPARGPPAADPRRAHERPGPRRACSKCAT